MKHLAITLPLFVFACNYSSNLGVTPGGMQDMNLARAIIETGQIPTADTFTTAGLFSEHSLPMAGSECNQSLCPRTATALSTSLENQQHLVVQLGFATNMSPDNFHRRPLNLSVAVDVSGSMNGGKLDLVKKSLHLVLEQLSEDDQLSLVTYGRSAKIKKRTLKMNAFGKARMAQAIDVMRANGSTNMEEGMKLSYELVKAGIEDSSVEHRVMLFTDAQPNVGATESGSFLGITNMNADLGIGLTVFGVGLDLGSELSNVLSQTRGGNSFFLDNEEDVARLFQEEFNFIVSPIAYNLDVTLNLNPQTSLVATYGAPSGRENEALHFGASTLFLSQRDGGIGVLLEANDMTEKIGSMDIRYLSVQGEEREERAHVQFQGGEIFSSTVNSDGLGVYKMAHLIYEVDALQAGSDFCEGLIELDGALTLVETAQQRITEAANQIQDEKIEAEVELLALLRSNIADGSENCWIGDINYYN